MVIVTEPITKVEHVSTDEIDIWFTLTADEYLAAGPRIKQIRQHTDAESNTEVFLKALEIASTMLPSKPQEGTK